MLRESISDSGMVWVVSFEESPLSSEMGVLGIYTTAAAANEQALLFVLARFAGEDDSEPYGPDEDEGGVDLPDASNLADRVRTRVNGSSVEDRGTELGVSVVIDGEYQIAVYGWHINEPIHWEY